MASNSTPAEKLLPNSDVSGASSPSAEVRAESTAPIAPAVPATTAGITLPSQLTLIRWFLVVLALYAIGWLLWTARPALTPFIIGIVLAYLLLPIVNRLDRKMPRWLAILTVYIGGIVLLVIAIGYVAPLLSDQFEQLFDNIPSLEQLRELGSGLTAQYERSVPDALREPLDAAISNALQSAQTNATTYARSFGTFLLAQLLQVINLLTFLIGFLVIPIWMFFVLNDEARGRHFVDRILHPRIRADFWNVVGIVNTIFSNYIRGQLILGVIVGSMVGVGLVVLDLFFFDINYVLLLALVAGITELIPIIGPVIGAVPGVLVAFLSGGVGAGFAVLALYIIVQQLENNFLVPRIIGESVGVHPAILTVMLIAMGQVFGLVGVVLAAPITATLRDLFVYTYRRLQGSSAKEARASISLSEGAKRQATQPAT